MSARVFSIHWVYDAYGEGYACECCLRRELADTERDGGPITDHGPLDEAGPECDFHTSEDPS